jgi:DNA-binding NtrC family response regulator
VQNPKRTILVVDDELSVITSLQHFFSGKDYDLLVALNLKDARELWARHAKEIKVLIADFQLPDGSGTELATQVSNESPSVKIIVMTGFPREVVLLPKEIKSRIQVLEKPFSPRELMDLVEDRL